MRLHGWLTLAALATLIALAASEVRSQEAQALGPDSFLVAVPIRDTLEIQRELGSAIQPRIRRKTIGLALRAFGTVRGRGSPGRKAR
jgi:hypothetical protein